MRKWKLFCVLLICLFAKIAEAQKNTLLAQNRVIFLKEDTLYQFYAKLPPIKKWKLNADKTYYWYSQNTIMGTEGAFSNRLLTDQFEMFYPNHNLCQQGGFIYGLKNGLWKTWYPNGRLHSLYNWQEGILQGRFAEFDENNVKLLEGTYKNNQLSGALYRRLASGKTIIVNYSNGELVNKDTPDSNKKDSSHFGIKDKQ